MVNCSDPGALGWCSSLGKCVHFSCTPLSENDFGERISSECTSPLKIDENTYILTCGKMNAFTIAMFVLLGIVVGGGLGYLICKITLKDADIKKFAIPILTIIDMTLFSIMMSMFVMNLTLDGVLLIITIVFNVIVFFALMIVQHYIDGRAKYKLYIPVSTVDINDGMFHHKNMQVEQVECR